MWNLVDISHQNPDGSEEIDGAHEGHEELRNFRDPSNATEDDQRRDGAKRQTACPWRDAEPTLGGFRHGVGLHHVADPKGRRSREHSEDRSEPTEPEAFGEHIHRAAPDDAAIILFAVVQRDGNFGVLRRHTDDARDEQPNQRARSAQENGCRDTRNIAHTHRGRQRRRESLKRRDSAFARHGPKQFSEHFAESEDKSAELHATRHKGQHEPGADKQYHHGRAPNQAVYGLMKPVECV